MGQALGRAINVTEMVFPAVPPTYDDTLPCLVKIPMSTHWTGHVPAVLIAPTVEDIRQLAELVAVCVIYFHPNAADIGDCTNEMELIRDGAFDGDAVILAPEYPGYGLLNDYSPSMEGIDCVASAAWHYAVDVIGFTPQHVVLWGRSIGCGPAANLGVTVAKAFCESPPQHLEDSDKPPFGAIVMIAPMISIIKVAQAHTNALAASLVSPLWEVQDLIADPSLEKVPICILHPSEDEIIPACHGSAVLETASSKARLGIWLRGASHNFILCEEHLERVCGFLAGPLGIDPSAGPPADVDELLCDPDEEDRQEIVSRLIWWSVSGKADTLLEQ